MIRVDGNELYKYIKEQSKVVKDLSDKELVLNIFATEHLQGHHDFYSGSGTAATGLGLVLSLIVPTMPGLLALSLVTGTLGAATASFNMHRSFQVRKISDTFINEITSRFEDPITAYAEISKMIQHTERDEILEFFEKVTRKIK